jgi:hypothetical protein
MEQPAPAADDESAVQRFGETLFGLFVSQLQYAQQPTTALIERVVEYRKRTSLADDASAVIVRW